MRYHLALFAVICGTCGAQAVHDETSLTIVLRGESVPNAVLAEMEREVDSAVTPSGIQLNWLVGSDGTEPDVPGQLVIIRMRGACRTGSRVDADPPEAGEPLAQTHVVNGRVLPIADVLCNAVRKLVDRDLRAAAPSRREELFGRALGRVTAHELYHILLRTTDHGHEGLSRAMQSSAALLAPRESFAPADERRIAESIGADAESAGR